MSFVVNQQKQKISTLQTMLGTLFVNMDLNMILILSK